eukprot:TRINITY_DN2785_c0_g1_i3.p1 TRINITY_DN2785_c0_g1~~TRINITY_DN2785_c0_g1_i3.p1  ORF type:complete len:684 (+),score=92.15 TRINITY_DN2785_c0_g1_i3:62-2113(+)
MRGRHLFKALVVGLYLLSNCLSLPMSVANPTLKQSTSFRSWILLDDDHEKVKSSLDRASRYGIQEIQLSHSIIMDIDDIIESPQKAENVRLFTEWIHERNMKSVVWAHEFHNVDIKNVCFDPADPLWEQRKDAYRQAFQIVPEVDGVVLMFGSAQVEPWYAICSCDYCMDNDTIPDPVLRSLRVPSPPERVKQITQMVYDVVVRELRKKLVIRTFIHRVVENEWIDEALRGLPDLDFVVMSKDVPQDFEPYYPDDWLFGRFSQPHILELDCAGEYWGQSVLPFAAPSYFERRFRHGFSKNASGYTARVSRGSNSAFDTPNEVNLLAASMLTDNPHTTSEQIFDRFVESRYGLSADSSTGLSLKKSLQYTYDIGRKMYYFLGFWALVKGSGLPSSLRVAEQLFLRSVAKWDADYKSYHLALTFPSIQTLIDLRQEKNEAETLSSLAQEQLRLAAPALSPADFEDLSYRLRHQSYCVSTWKEIAELVWATRLYRQMKYGNTSEPQEEDSLFTLSQIRPSLQKQSSDLPAIEELESWIDWSIKRMLSLADEIERVLDPARYWPCDPTKIRELAIDLRKTHPPMLRSSPRNQMQLSPPRIQIERSIVTITFSTSAISTAHLELGDKVPTYSTHYPTIELRGTEHKVQIEGLTANEWYAFRLVAEDPATGRNINGSDYWFVMRDTYEY